VVANHFFSQSFSQSLSKCNFPHLWFLAWQK